MESPRRNIENLRLAEKSTSAVTRQWAVRETQNLIKQHFYFVRIQLQKKFEEDPGGLHGIGR